jgi:hypothetical protein
MRQFLDGFPLFDTETPIWIAETGSHWAYSAWEPAPGRGLRLPESLDWVSDYLWDVMADDYLIPWLNWLRDNTDPLKIEKWFFFKSYIDVERQAKTDAYGGIYFFDSKDQNAELNPLGRIYREFSLGLR